MDTTLGIWMVGCLLYILAASWLMKQSWVRF
jgi:hypothetical protein